MAESYLVNWLFQWVGELPSLLETSCFNYFALLKTSLTDELCDFGEGMSGNSDPIIILSGLAL